MNSSFKAAVEKTLNRPVIVADRFHYCRYIHWAVDEVRRKVLNVYIKTELYCYLHGFLFRDFDKSKQRIIPPECRWCNTLFGDVYAVRDKKAKIKIYKKKALEIE